jgi:hypothetical protein
LLELGPKPERIQRKGAQRTTVIGNRHEALGQLPSDGIGLLVENA